MEEQVHVIKASGEKELFNEEKLQQSLSRAGALPKEIEVILKHIIGELVDGVTTNTIYRHAFELLKRMKNPDALRRYSLRRALLEFGPTGFPFEKFLAELWKTMGFETVTNQMVMGSCVVHEIDMVAWNEVKLLMFEAKFHNEIGEKSDLKTVLYVKARFDDLLEQTFDYGKKRPLDEGWLVTNTKFTSSAIQYGECAKVKMIGWNYPSKGNLREMIEDSGLHPITCLTTLSSREKQLLLKNGMVLCRHIKESVHTLQDLGLSPKKKQMVLDEAKMVCGI